MTGLLSAEAVIFQKHFFQYIAVPHLGGGKTQTVFFTEAHETHIGHNGADHGVAIQLAPVFHILCADGHDNIAVNFTSGIINAKAAIGISVKGNTGVQTMFYDVGLQRLKM